MAIDAGGWLDWATRMPGIPDKTYSERNRGVGLACHSIVGSINSALTRFLSTEVDDSGRYTPAAAASCMFLLAKSGRLIQMYPVTASTWTSGGREANTGYWAIEAEGGAAPDYREPLTRAQEDTFIRLVREWEAHTGNVGQPGVNIYQHKDLAAMYGYAPTACASDRYANAWQRLMEEDDMPDPRVDKLIAALGGEPAIDEWNARGNSLIAGYTIEQQKLGEHLAQPHGAPAAPDGVPDHRHEPGNVKR